MGPNASEIAHALGNFVADVARVDVGEDEGVGAARHGGARGLQLAHLGRHGGVELELAVHREVEVHALQLGGGVPHLSGDSPLPRALGAEGEQRHLGVDIEKPGHGGSFQGDLHPARPPWGTG